MISKHRLKPKMHKDRCLDWRVHLSVAHSTLSTTVKMVVLPSEVGNTVTKSSVMSDQGRWDTRSRRWRPGGRRWETLFRAHTEQAATYSPGKTLFDNKESPPYPGVTGNQGGVSPMDDLGMPINRDKQPVQGAAVRHLDIARHLPV